MRDYAVTHIHNFDGGAGVLAGLVAFVLVNVLNHRFDCLVIVFAGRVNGMLIPDLDLIALKLIAQPLKEILALEDEEVKDVQGETAVDCDRIIESVTPVSVRGDVFAFVVKHELA